MRFGALLEALELGEPSDLATGRSLFPSDEGISRSLLLDLAL